MRHETVRALLVEDNPADATVVREMLEDSERAAFRLQVVPRLEAGLEALRADEYDVVLVDLNLPDSRGLHTFLRLHSEFPDYPIILLTGLDDEGTAEQALKQGAQDYLVKDRIDDGRLDRSIRYAIERKRILQENIQLRERAEQASRAKDEFLATLSHELRTPLTTILGWAVLLGEGKLSPENTARALKSIEGNARLQNQLVDQLLDISRIITGKLSVQVDAVAIPELVQAAVDSVCLAAEAKQITVECDLDPELPPISADRSRLQQALWNLLSNAVKFTPNHGRIDVVARRAGEYAQIVVRDSGIGIPPRALSHVFERFHQADSSATREHGGLGLGLAIVKHIVEMHGGTVHAASEGEGEGSEFTLRFPLRARTGRGAEPSSTRADLAGVSVLVVEDEIDHAMLLKEILEFHGASVRVASGVAEGFRMFEEQAADAVLTDIAMPAEDGYALLKRIREAGGVSGEQTPVAAITAYGRNKARILEAGFDAYLPKPVEPPKLVRMVSNLLRRPTNEVR